MAQDFITLNAIANELNSFLYGGRVIKISQPEKDELVFIINKDKKKFTLVLSCNYNNPRVHISNSKKFNPYTAPMLCMFMRKYFTNARLESVDMYKFDRIMRLKFMTKNDLGDLKVMYVFVELMGRYSNIIICDENLVIKEAIHHLIPDEKNSRAIMPNLKYAHIEQNKINIVENDKISALLSNYNANDLVSYIAKNINGMAFTTVEKLLALSNISSDAKSLTEAEIERITGNIDKFVNINSNKDIFSPCVLEKNELIKDFSLFKLEGFDNIIEFETINESADYFYTQKDRQERVKSASRTILSKVRNLIKRVEKNNIKISQKLLECESTEKYREYADMILANIYKINKGAKSVEVDDFFHNCKTKIPLDEKLNAQQNASKYYKKYSKLLRTKGVAEKQYKENEDFLNYLESVKSMITNANVVADVDAIKEELTNLGILKKQNKRDNKPKSEKRIYMIDGFEVLCGRNNLENEYFTFKVANSNDIFMHAKNIHGSHVVILTRGKEVTNAVLEKSAEIASYYSNGRKSPSVEVDFTIRKNVKKHPSKMKGMVIYTDYKSILVTPNDNEEFLK